IDREIYIIRQAVYCGIDPICSAHDIACPKDLSRQAAIKQPHFLSGDRPDAYLDRRYPQVLYHAGHYRGVRMRRAIVCIAKICVRVDLQHAEVVIFFGMSLNYRARDGMLSAEHTKEFI